MNYYQHLQKAYSLIQKKIVKGNCDAINCKDCPKIKFCDIHIALNNYFQR